MVRKLALFAGITLSPWVVSANMIASYVAATDPLTQGWSLTQPSCALPGCSPGNPVAGAVNDAGTPAWNVSDPSPQSGSLLNYHRDVANPDVATAQANGWVLSANLRVLDPLITTPNPSVFVSYETGTGQRFILFFGTNNFGGATPSVSLGFDGVDNLIPVSWDPGAGGLGYHLYELKYDPSVQRAALFIDGTERIGNYEGDIFTVPHPRQAVVWGSDSSAHTGAANYASVSFSINDSAAPEPGSFLLLAPVLFATGWLRRRFRRD